MYRHLLKLAIDIFTILTKINRGNNMSRLNYDEKAYMNLVDLGIPYPDEWDYYFFKDNGYYYNE